MRAEVSPRGEDGASDESQTAVERAPVRIDEEASEPLPAGTVLGGRYEVRKLIGRGGMGLVVEAWDATLGVAVAIKIVRSEYAGERQWSERLAREVKLARKIQHPNVCRVFDFGQADGRAFLSMELAEGGTLRSQLAEGASRARPLADRLADARAVAAGVAAIHGAGIVHRDLSPQNVLRMKDGRLVVSDFGLATDSFDGASSIHGGTVAYMAPEVLRGGRASVAADIWSLGAVIHEVVFGERLRWDAKSAEVRSAVAGQALTSVERSVLEICRACTTPDPARRPRDAGQVADQLGEAALSRAGRRRWQRRAIAAATAGLVIVAAASAARLVQSRRRRAAPPPTVVPSDPLLIVPTGEPDDWTDKSKVLAEVPDRIRCMVALPDHHTVRFVWGYPARAADVDTRTGARKPSPLVPDAYAEGCPDLSSDGKRLVYTGHTRENRAFAFVSEHADGRDAIPEVPIAEPSMDSDPVWLPDGENFAYNVDDPHVAVFSMEIKRSLVLPSPQIVPVAAFRGIIGDKVFVTSLMPSSVAEIAGYDLPGMNERVRFHLPAPLWDLSSDGTGDLYGTSFQGILLDVTLIDPRRHQARVIGSVRGQSLRHLVFIEEGMAFVSRVLLIRLNVRSPSGQIVSTAPLSPDILWVSQCGDRIIATERTGALGRTVWLGNDYRTVSPVEKGDFTVAPRCSSDGRVIFWSRFQGNAGLERCQGGRCRTLVPGLTTLTALSPDEKRLAFYSIGNRVDMVRWMLADGSGPVHELAKTETACAPIWADGKDVWVSFWEGRKVVWREIDTDSGRPTGRTSPGMHDCSTGEPDPSRPLHDPVEIEASARSQIRFLPSKFLPTVGSRTEIR
ncbi:MAG TPA: serine/threonine-protein kinase [Polyangia bacterium]|nr:serine/threonine-protein kinase [Polyangia bacterium]